METWGVWTFSKENENLLVGVLNKFTTDQCDLDEPRKSVFSTLTNLSKKSRVEEISSSSSDDDDIDGDFKAVEMCFPKLCTTVTNEESVSDNIVTDILNVSLLSQPPAKDHENNTKLIVELLNTNDFDPQELYCLLKTEYINHKCVSEIVRDIWPEMITDVARHNLCEALIKTDIKPHIVCEQIYIPWFRMCESNLTGFIESVSKLIIHFPEYACKTFLIELLKDKESILVKHIDWLVEIMKSLDQQHWCTLLSEYMKYCNSLDQHQIPVLSHLVKNCQKGLNNNEAERLVVLCRNSVHEYSGNRDFASFLVSVVETIDLTKFRPDITITCGALKGALKFRVMKALKDTK